MSQLIPTSNELINRALYLIGELGTDETPDSFMLSTGIELLNEIINEFSADSIYIPYLTTIDFTLVAGQSEYTISDIGTPDISSDRLISLAFATYTVDTIVYPVTIISKSEYYNIRRLNNIDARPAYVFLNKQPTQSIITFYPAPDQNYSASIQVKSMLDKIEAHENLSQLPPYYYGFLKYALGRKFLGYYPSANWPPTNEETYQRYYQMMKSANDVPMMVDPSNILMDPEPYYWQNILAY